MNILLVFPTALEANACEINDCKQHSISILISGIGTPATIYSLTKYSLKHTIDLIVHAGICGSFTSDIQIGEVVQVSSDCFADIGVIERGAFNDIFTMGLLNKADFPFTNGRLVLRNNSIKNIKQVSAVTVNTISSNEMQIELLQKTYNPAIESMEGAAVHYVALQEKIPCIHLRAVSNYVGERDKNNWEIKKALSNLQKSLNHLISNF